MPTPPDTPAARDVLKRGWEAAWPICLGYVPLGLAAGVLSQKAGLHPLEIGLMSILVFAGSAQLIAVSMMGAGAGALAIISTTFTVNLRHILMSSTLSMYLAGMKRRWVSLFAYGVTDESFAVNFTRFRSGDWHWPEALVLNQTANLVWVLSTVVGGMGGHYIPEGAFGIAFTLSAMFLSLLVFQLRGGLYVLTGILAGGIALGLSLVIPGNTYIVLASMIGAGIGVLIKRSGIGTPKGDS